MQSSIGDPVTDIGRALSEISDIRAQLATTTRFHGYAPERVAVIGLAALALIIVQVLWPGRFAASDPQQVLVWGAVLVSASLAIAVEAIGRSRREHEIMAFAMLLGATRTVVPFSLAGFVIAAVVLVYAPGISWIVPGIWQMLIGLVAFASYATMPRAIVWPALWYLASGAVVLVLAGQGGAITPILAGGPLVVGHFALAWVLHSQTEERNARG
jgi:hypothetical protein